MSTILDNPSGGIYLKSKEQFAALCFAIAEVSNILKNVDEKNYNEGRVRISIKAVTDKCFSVEVGGLYEISDEEIEAAMKE